MTEPSKKTAAERRDALGMALADRLRSQAEQLDPAIEARLSSARHAALLAAEETRRAPEQVLVAAGVGGAQAPRQRGRWTLLLPALLLVIGLGAISHSQWLRQTLGLVDADAAVLRDNLPPNAYGDPGFNEYLDEKTDSETPPPDEEQDRK